MTPADRHQRYLAAQAATLAIRIALERVRHGLPTKSILLIGLRGVGKTVLLDRMRDDAEASNIQTLRIEVQENRSLPPILAPQLRLVLLRLSRNEQARELAQHALRALAGFVGALRLKYADIEVGLDLQPEAGFADNGDLEHDLQDLLESAGQAASGAETALAIFIDELQYVPDDELAALITALHRAAQRRLPIVLVGAGLPQLRGRTGRTKSYAERLFDFPEVVLFRLMPPDKRLRSLHAIMVPELRPMRWIGSSLRRAAIRTSAGMGQARMGCGSRIADYTRRCRPRISNGGGGT